MKCPKCNSELIRFHDRAIFGRDDIKKNEDGYYCVNGCVRYTDSDITKYGWEELLRCDSPDYVDPYLRDGENQNYN